MLILIGICVAIFWYFHAVDVRNIIRWIRYGEMWVLSWVIGPDYTFVFHNSVARWRQGFVDTPKWDAKALTYDHLAYFTALTQRPLRYVYTPILVVMGFWALLYGPSTQFRSKLNLEGLLFRQSGNFPVIAPFVHFNPSKQPPRPPGSPVPAELPLFAEALGPEEWLAYTGSADKDGKIIEGAAREAFIKQLGPRWKGPNALAPHQQILLAVFCLKASRKRKEADDMLGRFALCWSEKGLRLNRDRKLLREARRILRDKELSAKTLSQSNRHAYVVTALLRALAFARAEGGVLAPAQFVWLRGYDRALWYPLNNLGRQSFHMEAMGAMAHFKAERITQRPIPMPKIEDAITTLKEYMGSLRARPIPKVTYGQSKKKKTA